MDVFQAKEFTIAVTNGRTRTPAEWAELATKKLIQVADDAPEPIKAQALAFQTRLYGVIKNYIDMAVQEERNWATNTAQTNGSADIAQMIQSHTR